MGKIPLPLQGLQGTLAFIVNVERGPQIEEIRLTFGSCSNYYYYQMLLSHGLWVDKDASEGLVFHPKGRKEN